MLTVPILHHEPDFVVVDKPPGLLSVPGKGPDKADCVVARVRAMFPHASGPMVVHRLDMETSGLLVVALTPEAQRDLSMMFERRAVQKRYSALLEGDVAADQGLIDLPLRPDIDNRPVQIVDFVHGRPAQTRYRVLAREVDRTRIAFEPITGRSHQLRVHAAAPRRITRPDGLSVPGGLAAPIQGDVLYAGAPQGSRLMLHADRLEFISPAGRLLTIESPSPF